ncbi:MAG: hypothetical protein L3J11_06675 [Draconibacterium sp.]|nr:hypothetical protein [Draconibacterium sp.]
MRQGHPFGTNPRQRGEEQPVPLYLEPMESARACEPIQEVSHPFQIVANWVVEFYWHEIASSPTNRGRQYLLPMMVF